MGQFVRVCLLSVLVLGVALLSSPVTRGDDDDEQEKKDIKEAAKASDGLKKLIEAIDAKKDAKEIKRTAEDLNNHMTSDKKPDLKHVMWAAYKPRKKGGLGVGEKADTITPDGIEAKIISMSKKEMSDAQLKKESADLIKMAQVAKAIGEVSELNKPIKNAPGKPIADWTKFNDFQKKSAADLIDAVKAGKPDKVLDATKNLYSSCTNCHSTFRD